MHQIDRTTYDRRVFVSRFMREGGLTYSQACRVYDIMTATFADAVVTGNKATIGHVGAIVPFWRAPRDIQMYFRRRKGQQVETGIHRTYYMDGRFEFKFKLYRRFMETHQLKWLVSMPVSS